MLEITDALPMPTVCDNCKSTAIEYNEIVNFKLRQFARWPYVWFCHACRAFVGTHPNTKIPLGLMADDATRRLRYEAHEAFDDIWKKNLLSRSDAYTYLALALRIEQEQCHIAMLNKIQLKLTIEWAKGFERDVERIREKRKEKARSDNEQRNERTKSRIVERKLNLRSKRRGK